ncbi:MAG: hypothetical protein ACHQF2_07965 [Flavobacteriales bacterium]
MKKITLLISFSFLLLVCCAPSKDKSETNGENQEIDSLVSETGKIKFTDRDSVQDDLARFISGLPQNHSTSRYQKFEKEKYWQAYKGRIDKSWLELYENRLLPIRTWDTSIFHYYKVDTLPLFYPLSGPDFLHAYVLYPKTETFILLALEPIHDLPAIENLNIDNQRIYLQSIESSLQDIFNKSYFITTHMQDDLQHAKVKGVLPLFYFFMSRSALEIRRTEQITLDTAGNIQNTHEYQRGLVQGIRIIFKDGDKEKTLIYFRSNISDIGIKRTPELMMFLEKLGPINTFIKSASYMPHYSTFSVLRNFMLNKSQSIFQDDTGIPYKYFKSNKKFQTVLFGKYAQPVKDFGDYVFQKDLDSAFRDTISIRQLPFHLGYHWGDKKQAYILTRRKAEIK